MLPKTSGALTLRPTGTAQGSYYILSLNSGKQEMTDCPTNACRSNSNSTPTWQSI